MQFTVESWSPEYGISADEGGLAATPNRVDVEIEIAAADWRPLDPEYHVIPSSILFIDGVRRIDAQVWHTVDGITRPGVCASVAAGAVRCTPTAATVVHAEVRRGVFLEPSADAGPIMTAFGTYELQNTGGSEPSDLYASIHARMTSLELGLADRADADLVVFDGPLRGRNHVRGVGFIKTQHVQYLPDDQQRMVGRLGAGQRTPLFLIDGGGHTHWSWYVRLPGPLSHPLSGVVRCELPGCGTVDEARIRADTVTAVLPKYASEPHKDPRAPQNLYPIAGLESELRHRLGDALLLDRALRTSAARSVN